jgi:hypothetical protein
LQQASSIPPQTAQFAPTQVVSGAVQYVPPWPSAQHAALAVPHEPPPALSTHAPFVHVDGFCVPLHALPFPTHVPPAPNPPFGSQQPPPVHVSPSQQGAPSVPHVLQ